MPWIHISDVVDLFLHTIKRSDCHGPINAVAPNPVTNAVFTKVLGDVLHRPTLLPIPQRVLQAAFGEMAEILFVSQKVEPKKAKQSGYEFKFARIESALTNLLP